MHRSLRILFTSAVTVALFAAPSHALDFQGAKWGIGAPILFSDGTEIALMHVSSNASLWGLDISYNQQQTRYDAFATAPGSNQLNNFSNLAVGPRWRHFARADANFSPYWDLFADAIQQTSQSTSGANTSDYRGWGVMAGLGIGAEYMTRWHMSVAVHTTLLATQYLKSTNHTNAIGDRDVTQWNNRVGIQPFVYLRAYL
jgi:hypothetical protein